MNDLPPKTHEKKRKSQSDPDQITALAEAFEAAAIDIASNVADKYALESLRQAAATARHMAVSFRKLAKEANNPKSKGHSTDG